MKIGIYLVAALLAGALAVAACSDDSNIDDGTGGTGGNHTGGNATGGSNTGGSGGSNTGGSGGGNSGGAGGGEPTVCGGIAGEPCAATEYCDFEPSTCGGGDEQGLCLPRPDGCPDLYQPVCGCDGNVHGNYCDAYAAGVDLDSLGGCTPPDPSLFACGPYFCQLSTQYCQVIVSDIAGEDNSFECVEQPACPTQLDCGCLAQEMCGDICEGDPTSGLTLTCPGG
jgi:hypothetical protein